jgi:ribose transport system substrate-binding protein
MASQFGFFVGILGMLVLISGCGDDNSATPKKKIVNREDTGASIFKATELENTVNGLITAISKTEPTHLSLNVNVKGLAGYWEPVVVGANRAFGELELDGVVEAPDTTGAGNEEASPTVVSQRQVELLKRARENGVAGFGVSAVTDVLVDEINAASESGIPIVTIDSDLATSKRDLYVGTMNAEAGKTAGESLKEFLPNTPGTVIILGYELENWPDGYDRTMGTKKVLEDAGYDVTVRRTLWDEGGEAKDIQFMVDTINSADPPVVGMIGMFSNAFRCAMAAESAGKTGDDIAIGAFDFDPSTVSYMQSGLIKVTHAQRQYYMGYLTPYILYGMNILGKDETKALLDAQMVDAFRFDTGLDVVKANQLDAYYSFLDNLGIGGS